MPRPKRDPSKPKRPHKRGSGAMTKTSNPAIRKARIEQVVEWQLKGIPTADVAQLANVTPKTVANWNKEAERLGYITAIRDRMSAKLLPLGESAYEQILTASADELTKKGTVKAHTLKLKAAKELMDGLGAFQKHTKNEKTERKVLDLDGYYELRRTRAAAIDGELVNDEHIRQRVSGGRQSSDQADEAGGRLDGGHLQLLPRPEMDGAETGGRGASGAEGSGGVDAQAGASEAGLDERVVEGDTCEGSD